MECVAFADSATKAVGDSLLSTLLDWTGPVTVLSASQDVANSFCTQRSRPFTRCAARAAWAPEPLPPMTASVESNILSVLSWQVQNQARKMHAFATVDLQADAAVFLMTRGLVNVSASDLRSSGRVTVVVANGAPAALIVPRALKDWFFAAWLKRHTQASQEMLDALLDAPLTLDAFHKDLAPAHALGTFQWLAAEHPDRLEMQDAELRPTEFAASALAAVSRTLASTVPVNDVTGSGTAWLFFALVAVAVVLGIGVVVGGVRGARAAPSALELRWRSVS